MRVAGRGRIDRTTRVPFSFDGQRLCGHPGDTVASALLANGIRLVGRSFKYHRPRGILTAGSEEPNALVTIGEGSESEPNVRATVQELVPGLVVRSQNAWPSLARDVGALADLAAPLIPAGFYYKTFMGPGRLWERLYEPLIRRAAGLGALSGQASERQSEKAFAFCDVLVIGAGPAGLMAALTAARAGARVIVADEGAQMGGRLLFEDETVGDQPGADWAASVVAELAGMERVRLMPRTTVTGAYDGGTYAALERVGHHRAPDPDLPQECFWRIVAPHVVLAAGAIERPVVFPGNDRPGVMLAGAVRGYLNHWGVAAGQRVAVFGGSDSARRTARDLSAAGIEVTVVDPRGDAKAEGYRCVQGVVTATRGRQGLSALRVGAEWIAADCLAMTGGWVPSVHLSCHLGAKPVWRDDIAAFVPAPDAVPGMIACGAATGAYDTASCLQQGAEAGRAAAQAAGLRAELPAVPAASGDADAPSLWRVPGRGRAWLDFQNDVTTKDVALAAQEGFRSVEHMKRYTTQGMAPDQGRTSNVAALSVLAEATGRGVAETGVTTFRPPFAPVPIAAMGAGGEGQGFAPRRLTPSHAASVQRGAPMIEADLWYRPSYFPAAGETTWAEACAREVQMVRQAVGVCDVSTLGKIELWGPDVGRFLDHVYTNRMSTLRPGRVRYGLMLREDGHVMDDGTCARLSDDRWVVTTTTAAAGQVMRHLEYVHQCIRPGDALRMVSVTDAWAQMAVAGPRARDVLRAVVDDLPALPFMGAAACSVAGVPARLFRISFSGELGYELAVPARYGASLFRLLLAQAEAVGGGPYGMEALNVLRLEKGYVTHAEIDGRVTADDLGLGALVHDKSHIGREMSQRPGLTDPHRLQLVGLRPVMQQDRLVAGASLFLPRGGRGHRDILGHVTSVGRSPTLGHDIALALLSGGRSRIGSQLQLVDGLRGVECLCAVTDPVVYDPEGGRMRG